MATPYRGPINPAYTGPLQPGAIVSPMPVPSPRQAPTATFGPPAQPTPTPSPSPSRAQPAQPKPTEVKKPPEPAKGAGKRKAAGSEIIQMIIDTAPALEEIRQSDSWQLLSPEEQAEYEQRYHNIFTRHSTRYKQADPDRRAAMEARIQQKDPVQTRREMGLPDKPEYALMPRERQGAAFTQAWNMTPTGLSGLSMEQRNQVQPQTPDDWAATGLGAIAGTMPFIFGGAAIGGAGARAALPKLGIDAASRAGRLITGLTAGGSGVTAAGLPLTVHEVKSGDKTPLEGLRDTGINFLTGMGYSGLTSVIPTAGAGILPRAATTVTRNLAQTGVGALSELAQQREVTPESLILDAVTGTLLDAGQAVRRKPMVDITDEIDNPILALPPGSTDGVPKGRPHFDVDPIDVQAERAQRRIDRGRLLPEPDLAYANPDTVYAGTKLLSEGQPPRQRGRQPGPGDLPEVVHAEGAIPFARQIEAGDTIFAGPAPTPPKTKRPPTADADLAAERTRRIEVLQSGIERLQKSLKGKKGQARAKQEARIKRAQDELNYLQRQALDENPPPYTPESAGVRRTLQDRRADAAQRMQQARGVLETVIQSGIEADAARGGRSTIDWKDNYWFTRSDDQLREILLKTSPTDDVFAARQAAEDYIAARNEWRRLNGPDEAYVVADELNAFDQASRQQPRHVTDGDVDAGFGGPRSGQTPDDLTVANSTDLGTDASRYKLIVREQQQLLAQLKAGAISPAEARPRFEALQQESAAIKQRLSDDLRREKATKQRQLDMAKPYLDEQAARAADDDIPAWDDSLPPKPGNRSWWSEEAARSRIAERGTRLNSGIDPADALDRTIVAAHEFRRATSSFNEWARQMAREIKGLTRSRLQELWDLVNRDLRYSDKVPPASKSDNLRHANAALERVLAGEYYQGAAQYRPEIGWISFVKGTPGTAPDYPFAAASKSQWKKAFADGSGIDKIVAKRNWEAGDGEAVARALPEVLDKGEIFHNSENRVLLHHKGLEVMLSKDYYGSDEIWVVTGYSKRDPGELGKLVASTQPTHAAGLDSANDVGARSDSNPIPNPKTNQSDKSNDPRRDTQGGFVRLPDKTELIDGTRKLTVDVAKLVNETFGLRLLERGGNAVLRSLNLADADGNLKVGAKTYGTAQDLMYREANPDSPVGKMLNWVRGQVVSDFGLPKEYRGLYQRSKQSRSQIVTQALRQYEGHLKTLSEQDRLALYDLLTNEHAAPGLYTGLRDDLRKLVDDLGQRLVDAGALDKDVYESNKGTYLARAYKDYEANLTKPAAATIRFTKRMKTELGQFKGRGLQATVEADRLPRLRQAGTDNRGRPVYEHRGEKWSLVGKRGTKAILHRDWNKAERMAMGEIEDGTYSFIKTMDQLSKNVPIYEMYKGIADTPTLARRADALAPDEVADLTNKGWELFGDNKVQGSNSPRWGALAGHFVEPNVARDLKEILRLQQRGIFKSVMTFFKKSKTIRNPSTHWYNIWSNLTFLELNGGNLSDIVPALWAYAGKGDAAWTKAHALAREYGVYGDNALADVRASELEKILRKAGDLPNQKTDGITKVLRLIRAFDDKLADIYGAEDEIFRLALFKERLDRGMPVEQAAHDAKQGFVDYDIRAPFVNRLRETVMPFLAWSYRATPLLIKGALTNPVKALKLAAMWQIYNYVFSLMAGGNEDEERAAMSDGTLRNSGLYMRLPNKDAYDQQRYLDTSRYIPLGDVIAGGVEAWQTGSAKPLLSGIAGQFDMGGPLPLVYDTIWANNDRFTGRPIADDNLPLIDQFGQKARYLADGMLPPLAGGDQMWSLVDAAVGRPDKYGRRNPLPEAAGQALFGIKTRPVNTDELIGKRADRFEREQRYAEGKIRQATEAYAQGRIPSEEAYNAEIMRWLKLMQASVERFQRYAERVDKAASPTP